MMLEAMSLLERGQFEKAMLARDMAFHEWSACAEEELCSKTGVELKSRTDRVVRVRFPHLSRQSVVSFPKFKLHDHSQISHSGSAWHWLGHTSQQAHRIVAKWLPFPSRGLFALKSFWKYCQHVFQDTSQLDELFSDVWCEVQQSMSEIMAHFPIAYLSMFSSRV